MSDRLYKSRIIRRDDVSPDTLTEAIASAIASLETDVEERATRRLGAFAVDWNTFWLQVHQISEDDSSALHAGDTQVLARVDVLS